MGSLNLNVDKANYTRLKRKDKGFTLIELVLVIILIGILVSAAIFAYIGYEKMTNKSVAKQNFVTLMTAKNAWCHQANQTAAPTMTDLGPFIGSGAKTDTSELRISGDTGNPTYTGKACGAGADALVFSTNPSITCTENANTDSPSSNAFDCQ